MDSNSPRGGVGLSLTTLDVERPNGAREYAEAYSRMGLVPVPNQAGGKRPTIAGWNKLRPSSRISYEHFEADQNVGLLLGEPSGWLVDVDLDCPEARVAADRFLPDTLTSGRKGAACSHRLFVSEGARSKSWRMPGEEGTTILELRSAGRQSLVEPSVHPTGERYEYDKDGPPEPVEIPAERLEQLCLKIATAAAIARRLPAGGRHDFALPLAGYLLRRPGRLDEEDALAVMLAAWHAAGADTPEALGDVERIVRDTARRISPGQQVSGGPALEELAPGLVPLLAGWWRWRDETSAADASAGGGRPTEDELRDRWIESRESPTAHGQGEWRRYADGFWAPVHQEIINLEIDGILEDAKIEKIRPTAGMRGSVERLARSKAFVADEVWDADTDILVCQNGTLEISSEILREHRPEDFALGALPFDFDPNARAPAFHAFLASTVPEAAPFLGEFAGYSLTTDTSLEIAVWLFGPPGSGKSSYIEGIRGALGPRAGLLGLADIQRSQFALADLPGKTLVLATEQPADYIRSTDVLNAIISGEPLRVEQKYKPAHTVIPRAKVLWSMNDLPRVRDAGSGLFRRVKVVPFPRLRVQPDPAVKEAIRGEGQGILAWALAGLRRLRARGYFEVPGEVRAATDEFRKTSDVPAMFVAEACIVSDTEGYKTQAKALYECYRIWCMDNGHKPLSSTALAKEWRRLGFGKRTLGGRAFYTGVKVDEGWLEAREDQFESW